MISFTSLKQNANSKRGGIIENKRDCYRGNKRFIYNVILIKVTMNKILKEDVMRKIFGKVEIDTITKKMEGKKLKQVERNYLYRSIRPKLIAASILHQGNILQNINKGVREDASLIEYSLSEYGYSIISLRKTKHKKIPLEELIVKVLIKYPHARFIEAIPFLLIKNKADKFKLLELASKYGIKNKIGYLLETAFMLKPIPHLKDLLSYLKSNIDPEVSILCGDDYDFLSRTSPLRIRKWNLLGRFFDEDFFKLNEAYL